MKIKNSPILNLGLACGVICSGFGGSIYQLNKKKPDVEGIVKKMADKAECVVLKEDGEKAKVSLVKFNDGKKISTDKKSDSSRVIIDEIGFQVEEMDPEVKQKYKVNVIGVLVTGLFSGSEERIPVNLSKCK